jgi:hypothetical protein
MPILLLSTNFMKTEISPIIAGRLDKQEMKDRSVLP